MKKSVKITAMLSVIVCVFGISIRIYAVGTDTIDNTVSVEEFNTQINEIDERLSQVEDLTKDEIIAKLLESEDMFEKRMTFWMTVIAILVTLLGVVFPIFTQRNNNKGFEEIKTQWKYQQKEISIEFNRLNNVVDETRYELRQYVEDKTTEIQSYVHFAMALNQDDPRKKIELYTKSIELNPEYADAYNNRGNSYMDIDENDKALADYSRAIEINPNNASTYTNRGNAYVKINEPQKALVDYNNAIDLNPNNAETYNNRGVLYKKTRKTKKSLEDFNKAIEINLNYADAFFNRSLLYLTLKKYKNALIDINKAIELDPDDKEFKKLKQDIENKMKKQDNNEDNTDEE